VEAAALVDAVDAVGAELVVDAADLADGLVMVVLAVILVGAMRILTGPLENMILDD